MRRVSLLAAVPFLVAIFLQAQVVRAESVVTLSAPSFSARSQVAYLPAGKWSDQGYLSIRASVSDPPGHSCIAPTGKSGLQSIFAERSLEVVITAQVLGLHGLDGTQEIPIAVYNWQGDRYCRTAWRFPVQLAPVTPTKPTAAPVSNPRGNPELVLHVRSVSKEEERLSGLAQSLLGIASAYAAPAGAELVSGLTKIASGPAVKFLSDEFNARARSSADQTFVVELPWTRTADMPGIVDGLSEMRLQLVQTDILKPWFAQAETVQQAVQRAKKPAADVIPVLDIRLGLFTRRSVFVEDGTLFGADAVPPRDISTTGRLAILNYPRKGGMASLMPTVNQSLHQIAPSFQEGLQKNPHNECQRLFTYLADTGFNRVDRALVAAALFEEAIPGWNGKPEFYNLCFGPDARIMQDMEVVFGTGYLQKPAPGTVFREPEMTSKPEPFWQAGYTDFLARLRTALFSQEPGRSAQLREIFPGLGAGSVGWPQSLPAAKVAVGADYFSSLAVLQAGCFFGYRDANGSPHVAMLVSAHNKDLSPAPYVLVARLSRSAGAPGGFDLPPAWVGLHDLKESMARPYVAMLAEQKFPKGSVCHLANDADRTEDKLLPYLLKVSGAGK